MPQLKFDDNPYNIINEAFVMLIMYCVCVYLARMKIA